LPPYLAGAVQVRLLTMVENYLRQLADEHDGGRPVCLESKLVDVFPDQPGLEIIGKIDRIDQAGEAVRVIDYKSGRNPWRNQKRDSLGRQIELLLGYQMQPYLYPWLVKKAGMGKSPEFQFVFLGENPPVIQPASTDLTAEDLLKSLAEVFTQGYYFPTSSEALQRYLGYEQISPCAWCEFISVCRRFEGSSPYHGFDLFRQRVSERFKAAWKLLNSDDDKPAV